MNRMFDGVAAYRGLAANDHTVPSMLVKVLPIIALSRTSPRIATNTLLNVLFTTETFLTTVPARSGSEQ